MFSRCFCPGSTYAVDAENTTKNANKNETKNQQRDGVLVLDGSDLIDRGIQDSVADIYSKVSMYRNLPVDSLPLTMQGYRNWARLVDIYDGDTCTVVVPIPGLGARRIHIRLEGINTPEMRSCDPQQKQLAILAKKKFADLVMPGLFSHEAKQMRETLASHPVLVWIECRGNDKYGRTLAKVYPCQLDYMPASTHINLDLVVTKHAEIFMPSPNFFLGASGPLDLDKNETML